MQKLITLDEATKECSFDQHVINRFLKIYSLSETDAYELLKAVKQFLWISQKRRLDQNKETPILFQQYAMDEMWHNFILFTKAYHEYCTTCYGHYLHHSPAVSELGEDSLSEAMLKENLFYIEKYLGLKTVNVWYVEWPEKFSKQAMISKMLV